MADEGRPSFSELADAMCEWADQGIRWRKPSMQRLNVQLCAQPLLGVVLVWLESQGQAALAARLERMYQTLVREAADFDALCKRQASTMTDAGDEETQYREFDCARQSLQGGAYELAETLRAMHSATEPQARSCPMSRDEANIEARKFLTEHPMATARDLAKGIGCALGLIPRLSAWKAVREQRKKAKNPRTPKAVTLTEGMENAIGAEDDELGRLIDDQRSDSSSDGSIDPFGTHREPRFHKRKRP